MAMLGKRRPTRTAERRLGVDKAPTARVAAGGMVIERLAHDGRGVARAGSGKTLFVDGALPGERVDVAVHRSRRRFDEAHVRKLLEASPERATPPCKHYGRCGGCDLQHLVAAAQRRHKREVLVELLVRQGIKLDGPPILLAGAELGYRRRARLGVKVDGNGRVHLGFRARGSQHLVDIEKCPILETPLANLLPALRECLESMEAPRQVGHVELIAGERGVAVAVRQLRPHGGDEKRWRRWAVQHGVALGLLEGREQGVLRWLDETPRLGYTLKSRMRHIELGFAPGDFLQVNAEVNQALIDTALDWLAPRGDERVLDLFAGIGNFSLALAPYVNRVTAVEGSEAMVRRLEDNARCNALHNVEAQCRDLSRPTIWDSADMAVLDPPRGGARVTCQSLAMGQIPRILYVSCDPATLARDAALLIAGGYRIACSAVVDMFAQTAHLETMVLFEK